MRRSTLPFFVLLTVAFVVPTVHALSRDEIALVVNRSVPESTELATFYAQARDIPGDRIIPLDLPATDEIPFDMYEQHVRPAIRRALRDRGLEQKVRCLVTFYGVPLRIGLRVNTPQDNTELEQLKQAHQQVIGQLDGMVGQAERRALEVNGAFKPVSADRSLEALAQRMKLAISVVEAEMRKSADESRRQELTQYLNQAVEQVTGEVDADDIAPASAPATATSSADPSELPFDPEARRLVRDKARQHAGIFTYAKTLQTQIDYLSTDDTAAALDSELSLLWWPTYSRVRWQPNRLNPHLRAARAPPAMMVMRLDGPTVQVVRDIVATSIRIEKEGLSGKLVVDARGLNPLDQKGAPDAFGVFDERLRSLARHVQASTDVPVVLDDRPEVMGPNSVEGVALYCGWYSLHTYVPAMKFNAGAVGYHVASFELVSLRDPAHPGWVRGLLENGVVASVGPVAEPYLHSFPAPDEFFTLLLSGKQTLAEVYWTCTPLASWMQTCIGDPLYNPYQKNPRIKLEDLSPVLRSGIPARPG
jgi:uncharacterized protein (TIGR03790 family)